MNSALRKMVAVGPTGLPPVLLAAAAALDLAFGKCSRTAHNIEAALADGQTGQDSLPDLLAAAPDPGLLLILELASGAQGLIWLDALLVNAVIEVETHAPDSAVLREARKPTLIDATLCRTYLGPILAEFIAQSRAAAGNSTLGPITIARHETDTDQLGYAMAATTYGWVEGRVDFQSGLRGGALRLALPLMAWGEDAGPKGAQNDPAWTYQLTQNVLSSPYCLMAVMEVIEVPLGRAMALKVGDILPISPMALSDLKLTAPNGKVVLEGRLGQYRAKKAISVTGAPMLPDFAAAQPSPTPKALTSFDEAALPDGPE